MPNRDKNTRWGRFLLFFAILFFLVELFNYIPVQTSNRKNGNFWPYFFNEIPENSLDIVFMGNSHSKTTFIPEIIDKLLGTRSIHVNTSGESIFQTIYEYQEVLQSQNPRLVVLETFPIFNGLTRDELKPWNFSFFYSMPISLRKVIYSYQFFTNRDLLIFYMPFTSNHANWKNPGTLFSNMKAEAQYLREKLKAGFHVDLPHQGYENYLISLPPEQDQPQAIESLTDCTIPDFDERLLTTDDVLKISREEKSGLILIEAPQYDHLLNNCRNQVIDLAQKNEVTYQVLLEDKDLSPLWFGDDEHMTQFGAIIATVETAKILGEKLDIALNQEMLKYYQSYYFLDYTLIQKEDTIIITLIPDNYENIKDVDFKWDVSLNDDIFIDHEEKGGNILKFTLPKPTGNYFIHVVIHNPLKNYYLRGGFTFVLD